MATNEKFRVGSLNGVCATDRAKVDVAPTNADGTANSSYNYGGGNPHGYGSAWFDGGHEFVVGFAVAAIGDPIYITSGNALSASSSGNQLYGHALTTKGAPSGPLTVRLAN